ncbi:hypothetical protein NST04_29155 [Paenibacillus sp. FSL H7-0756]|uniref:hypothetical protein n=1 Tax=Paenibacillus sp. FSL H7-0756 TaxID=2954738 RepID=UPI0030FCA34A
MKTFIERMTMYILVMVLLVPSIGIEADKAAAAGEIIEFNEYTVPARSLTGSRGPIKYEGEDNWYPSTMYVDMPANTFNVKWDKVRNFFYITMSNSYMPTRWEMYREGLGGQPKNFNTDRSYHGYTTYWSQSMEIVYKDGSSSQINGVATGPGGYMFQNRDLSGYHNALAGEFNNVTSSPMWYGKIILSPDWPDGYYLDWNSTSIIPYSEYVVGVGNRVPAYLRITFNFAEVYQTFDKWNFKSTEHYPYGVSDVQMIPLSTNKKPNLTLTSQNGQNIINDAGLSTFNVEGYVQDPDNDTVDVIAEIPNVFYKKITLANTGSAKNFTIPIDVLNEGIPPGWYNVNVKVVDPFNLKAEASTSFSVTNRLRNKAFLLINSPIDISTSYADYENDGKYAERYRYDQDPAIFDNSMGMIWDSGLWRDSKYPSFPFSGAYTATFQARDNPKGDDRFDNYRMWSRDNLSSMTFMVHRKPVALFSAKLIGGTLQLTDSSYDLDHMSSPAKGLVSWQWQWRKAGNEVWTEGQPPAQLPSGEAYEIRLRVRDIDGPNGFGVWSDWMQQSVGSAANLPPVALFTVSPTNVSYRKATTIIDKSFDPDNDPLDVYSWTVIKDGWQQVWSYYSGGAAVPPNIAAFGMGSYQINLQVHDNRGLWSNVYSQTVQVINHPPAASFTMPNEVYRDTVISLNNLTPDPDEDGDALQYGWYTKLNNDPYYWRGSNRNQVFRVQDVLNDYGISAQKAISDGWEMRLNATDGSLYSYATQMFSVKNHVPTAAINGPAAVNQYDTHTFTSSDADEDIADQSSLKYYWRVTGSDHKITLFQTPGISLAFDELGTYTLEHWAVDQIGDKSNIATLKVTVKENLAPKMTLTYPAGTVKTPTIIDAEKEGDPLIKWTYSDPENDPQERYRLEFFTKDGLLVKTVENADSTGSVRQYQLPDQSLDRFLLYTVQGRAFSKRKWSEISNEKAFIIDNPPKPGFTLITDTGKDATKVPIYRTDVLNIQSTATDADIPKGDSISHQYFLKPAVGAEALLNTQVNFTKQFTSNGTFALRQVVTDSLGLYRELIQNITVVNRLPVVNITYPSSSVSTKPTIVSTLTPIIKWDYQDEDGDPQQRFRVRIIDSTNGQVIGSGEQNSSDNQWQVPVGRLVENVKYVVEMEVYDGFEWSNVSAKKFMMVNLLSIKGAVQHTEEWNGNRQAYNMKQSGSPESPRGYNVYWAGEKFVLQGTATGLPDTVQVTMTGGYTAALSPAGSDKTLWTGELADPSFEQLPDGPVTFTFTATNEYQTKVDTVTVTILGDWTEYYQSHRIK